MRRLSTAGRRRKPDGGARPQRRLRRPRNCGALSSPDAVLVGRSVLRNSSRRSWIEAMTRPIGTPISTSTASRELQAGLDGLRHRVVDAELVERGRVAGIARAGHDREVGALGAGGRDHRLDAGRVVQGDDEGARALDAAAAQELRVGAVAEIDRLAGPSLGRARAPDSGRSRDSGTLWRASISPTIWPTRP